MKLVKDIHHELYNYEITENNITKSYVSDKRYESFDNYEEIVDAVEKDHCNNFKSEYYVSIYYKDEDGVCNWLKPVNVVVSIYLTGTWANIKYLKRVCKKWHLNISDFKIGYNDFGEIYCKYSLPGWYHGEYQIPKKTLQETAPEDLKF